MDKPTYITKVYDYFYGSFAAEIGYKASNAVKSRAMDEILSTLEWDQKNAIEAMCRYHKPRIASKMTGKDKRRLTKQYDLAVKHMYCPSNISIAVPEYFAMDKGTLLTADDFFGKKYILNALNNKCGIIYREQLLNHLDNGWFYLYCLSGCGDIARQYILMAIDRWNGKDVSFRGAPDIDL